MNAVVYSEAATISLSEELLKLVRSHLQSRPREIGSNLEVINALAITLAPLLASANEGGRGEQALDFFENCLNKQIEALERERSALP